MSRAKCKNHNDSRGDLREVLPRPLTTSFPKYISEKDPEAYFRQVWKERGFLAVSVDHQGLGWDYRALVEDIGKKLYGPR